MTFFQDEVIARFDDLRAELGDDVNGKTMRQNELVNGIKEGILILKFGKASAEYKNAIAKQINRRIETLEKIITGEIKWNQP